ncbi:MAG: phosphoenolpyruvate--protein phosphotransferase [Calditrichaeota bacterium]|nr:phosphoenolpyruvate--protein phosphotransferase [Calditrichota bacterium]
MKNSKTRKIKQEIILTGIPTSPGIASGPAYIFRPFQLNISELEIKVEDINHELDLFNSAIEKVLRQLENAQKSSEAYYQDQFSEIFESQKAFLKDPILINEIKQEIQRSQSSAAFAISKILSKKSEYFINLENRYFRERAYDIIDLKHKLVNALLGIDVDYQLTTPAIVVAEVLSPSDTVNFNRNFILGFLTDKGGRTSHAAIMARGLRIPAVVNRYNLSQVLHDGDYLILDGFTGAIIINPTEETRKKYKNKKADFKKFEQRLYKEIELPAVTLDGVRIQMLANIEFVHEVNDARINKAEGIGLFRTESFFIEQQNMPSEDQQFSFYKQVIEQMNGNEVTIRVLDLGGDKILPNNEYQTEMNPFLGWRAIRFLLDRPSIFKAQLRAILRASAYGNVQILLPMISSVDEILKTKALIEEVKKSLLFDKIEFNPDIKLGAMIETPAAAMLADILTEYVDFFSIGTNDLTQYVLAIDRTNEKVSKYFSTFNPAVLNFVEATIKAAEKKGLPITLCGEFAAVPEAIPILLGMGLRSLSMNPFSIAGAKKIIRSLKLSECEKLYQDIKNYHTADEIEKACSSFVKRQISDLQYLK